MNKIATVEVCVCKGCPENYAAILPCPKKNMKYYAYRCRRLKKNVNEYEIDKNCPLPDKEASDGR